MIYILSNMAATGPWECAILLIAGVLFWDFRRSRRRHRLLLSMKSTLQAGAKLIIQEEPAAKAA